MERRGRLREEASAAGPAAETTDLFAPGSISGDLSPPNGASLDTEAGIPLATRLPHCVFDRAWLLEDNTATAERSRDAGTGPTRSRPAITIRLHRVDAEGTSLEAESTYEPDSMRSRRTVRIEEALGLLRSVAPFPARSVLVAGSYYGATRAFLASLAELAVPFIVEVRPRSRIDLCGAPSRRPAAELLTKGSWEDVSVSMPDGGALSYRAAILGPVDVPSGTGWLFAAHAGGIEGFHKGTILGIASFKSSVSTLVQLAVHLRRIRVEARRAKRDAQPESGATPSGAASAIRARANIALARRHDERAQQIASEVSRAQPERRGVLRTISPVLNVFELFAGAGGMGLGFLLAGERDASYRILYSGEANPIFCETLRRNHRVFDREFAGDRVARTPQRLLPTDLRDGNALDEACSVASAAGGAHIVIAGPPCQGFSTANRNSWSSRNPNNELVDVFVRYIERLRPLVFLMENVQGILWTRDAGRTASVVDVVERRLNAAGFAVYPKLIDAAWFGVPQHRTRFFLMGLHQDLGYAPEAFGEQGPFPLPTHGPGLRPAVTVRQAIADLPAIGNGHADEASPYPTLSVNDAASCEFLRYARRGAPDGTVFDHVTSRHAAYVIERYRRIPPGGNWESIRDDLTNYADVSRTHSNIYRRLLWDEPSITIGHYRKSMLIHPNQHRGLSLREAARLQSFPDWFRFSGTADGSPGGLMHKQQQLANAVSPLVTKAIAECMLEL